MILPTTITIDITAVIAVAGVMIAAHAATWAYYRVKRIVRP